MNAFGTVENNAQAFKTKTHSIQQGIISSQESIRLMINKITTSDAANKNQDLTKMRSAAERMSQLDKDVTLIINDFNLTMSKHILAVIENDNRDIIPTQEYYQTWIHKNYEGQVEQLVTQLSKTCEIIALMEKKFYGKAQLDNEETRLSISHVTHSISEIKMANQFMAETEKIDICHCGEHMVIHQEQSEYRCPKCGTCKSIEGTIFRDDQYFSKDGHKVNYNGYEPTKHFKFWMDRLQARENKEFNKEDLDKINRYIIATKKDRTRLTGEQMRAILKAPEVKLTGLNDNVASLIKLMGGPSPPVFDYEEINRIQIKFNIIIRLHEVIIAPRSTTTSRPSKPYYLYYIMQAIKSIFRNDAEKMRFMRYVHLQSSKTLMKHDCNYRDICEAALPEDGLFYEATDPAQHW